MKVTNVKVMKPIEEEPPSIFIRIRRWFIEKLNTLAFHISRFYFWSRLNWTLPILAILAAAYLYSFCAAENWWMKEKVVSVVPTTFVRTAKAAEVEEAKPTYTITQIVNAVHILESSGGKNDGCKKKGLVNGYGYAQHGSGDVWTCFKTHAQVRALVEQWYTNRVETMGLSTALCYYNTGHKLDDCTYYQNFLKVVKS